MSQDREAHKGVEVVDLNEYVKKLELEQSGGHSRKQGRGIVRRIAEVLAYSAVMTRGELEEISKGSSVGRQMLSFLKKCRLICETRTGYIISVPWLLYFYKYAGNRWVEHVRRLAPLLRDDEVEELRKVIEEVIGTPLEKFVDARIAITTELENVALIPVKYMPEKCDTSECFRQLLKYSTWLLTVVMGLLELYIQGAGFREIIGFLKGLSVQSRKLLEAQELEGQEERPLSYYTRLLVETAGALQRVALNLSHTYGKSRSDVVEKAVEWATQKYKEAVGVGEAKKEYRAVYYAKLFLDELSSAVTVDVATRITLFT
uniref:Uncharacterized protein n=1 Tax=Fervidicoccus fontis TaxID=683846 RepID=A0A7J3ZIF4_9CREN